MDHTTDSPEHDLIDAARKTADKLSSVLGAAMPAGDLFPGYDVVRQVGRGGQGVVYEATQRATKRKVAIKAMRGGVFITARERTRFQREVEFAARLQHPNIVSVLDSGIHQGRDFFVMEYVEGARIDQVEHPGSSSVRETLGLMAEVCDVVDYAHQRGVLHRDLKPSNIIIDGRRQPHVLDFGLAKAMDPAASSAGGITISEPGQILGTLGYMSPEQSRGQFEQMSVRSDVYSLGAMTYQLLTGALPCRMDGALNDILERIAHQDPARPSSVRRQLDADIDAILLKALDKAPARRYPTAGELGADIRRYLADESIQARRIGMPTRVARWTRRHRAVSAVSVAALTIIITIGVTSIVQLQAQASQNRLVSEFLQELLALFDPEKGVTPKEVLKQALDKQAEKVEEALSGNPGAEAEVRNTLGELYTKNGEYKAAEEQLRLALAIRVEQYGESSLETAETQRNLGFALKQMNQFEEAEALYRAGLGTLRERLDANDYQIAYDLTYLGGLLHWTGKLDEAEEVLNESLAIRLQISDEDEEKPRKVAIGQNMLALVRLDKQDYAGAEALFRDALGVFREKLSETEPLRAAMCSKNLADCLRATGQLAEAEARAREALEIFQRVLPGDHPDVGGSLIILGRILTQKGDLVTAQESLQRVVEIYRAKLGEDHTRTGKAQSVLGECLTLQGKFLEAEPLLLEGYQTIEAAPGRVLSDATDALTRIVNHYNASGRPSLAAQYQAKLDTAKPAE